MTKRKESAEDVSYQITLKGLISLSTGQDFELAQKITDDIELYLRRHYMKEGGYGAIIFDGERFLFTEVERHDDEK